MEKVIACCGINCANCDARIATLENNNELRAQTAQKWSIQFGAAGITPEMINCTGCREEGVKFSHCTQCEIRNCAISNNFQTCADCDKLAGCELVAKVHTYLPEALDNLNSLN
jgi:hypothetical protein